MLYKSYRYVEKLVQVIIAILLACMVIVVFSNVIARYFLNATIAWSEEISRFIFIWLVLLGAFLAFVKNEHLGLDFLVKSFPRKVSLFLIVLADVLVLTAIILILIGGYQLTVQTIESGWTSPAVEVPYGYIYLAVPVGFFLLLVQGSLKLAINFRNFFQELKGR